jgi:hypothetical protein
MGVMNLRTVVIGRTPESLYAYLHH